MEMALRASDLQRDTRGTYRWLEIRLEEYWAKYMDHETSTTAFLRACGSLHWSSADGSSSKRRRVKTNAIPKVYNKVFDSGFIFGLQD